MATPAEIANDLRARARRLEGTHDHDHAMAMRRGALIIEQLRARVQDLEAEALRRDARPPR